MPVPELNQEDLALEILPPSKRANITTGEPYPYWIALFKGISTIAIFIYNVFKKYMYGGVFVNWSSVTTYNKGDRVKDQFGVYESLKDSNLANPTSDETFWYKILSTHIGAYERVNYNYQRIVLEYALNRRFDSTFRQPTSYSGTGQLPLSDIYIESVTPDYYSILGFDNLHPENSIYSIPTGFFAFDGLISTVSSFYQFSVNIPSSVYALIDSNPVVAEKIVRNFVDKYRLVGVQYIIIIY